ncbi:MAG: hypothetical protein U0990_04670 [Candidatus Nanopelagicales bacterium]|nr:hypothetical protein [Candidatus Nanopelagicales bacterium]MDZ4249366.1 hypothetical protein [Candidatus Nanopelagicales bacterium]
MTARTFQATDLARDHRTVLDQARESEALIRDKGGTTLAIVLLDELRATREVSRLALELLRIEALPQSRRVPTYLGDLAWLTYLDEEEYEEFVQEFRDALFLAASTHHTQIVDQLLYSWRATAEINSDPELSYQLLHSVDDYDDEVGLLPLNPEIDG